MYWKGERSHASFGIRTPDCAFRSLVTVLPAPAPLPPPKLLVSQSPKSCILLHYKFSNLLFTAPVSYKIITLSFQFSQESKWRGGSNSLSQTLQLTSPIKKTEIGYCLSTYLLLITVFLKIPY